MLFASSGLSAEAVGVAAALSFFAIVVERLSVWTGFGDSGPGVNAGDGVPSEFAGGIAGCSSEPLMDFCGVGDGEDELPPIRLDSGDGLETR